MAAGIIRKYWWFQTAVPGIFICYVRSDELVRSLIISIVDTCKLFLQRPGVSSQTFAQIFQRCVMISQLGIDITQKNDRILWQHENVSSPQTSASSYSRWLFFL